MGQYYRAAVMDIKTSAPIKIFESYDYEHNGAKLTEHSYIGNGYVEAVLEFIADNGPARLMWCGDYAPAYVESEIFPNPDWSLCNRTTKDKVKFLENIWADEAIMGDEADKYPGLVDVNPFNQARPFYNRIRLIHNQTKNLWIDLQDYDITHELDLHPIPLLTAIGNECGGGDYYGPNKELCGTWAGDVLHCIYDEEIWEMPQKVGTNEIALINFKNGTQVLNPKCVKIHFEDS